MQVESMQEVFPDRNPDDSPDQMTLGANLGDDDISRQSTLVLSPSATDGVNVGFLVVNNTNPFTNQMVIPSGIPFPTASACHVAPGNDWYRRWWIRGRVWGLQSPGQCVSQGVMCLNKINVYIGSIWTLLTLSCWSLCRRLHGQWEKMKYLQQFRLWCLLQGHPHHRGWWRQLGCLPLLNLVSLLGKVGWMMSFLLPHLPGRWWNSTGPSSSEQNQLLSLQAQPQVLWLKAQPLDLMMPSPWCLPQVLFPRLQWLLLTLPMLPILPQLTLPMLPQPEWSLSQNLCRQNLFLQFRHPPWFPLRPACLSQKPRCPPLMWLWLQLWPERPQLIWCPAHQPQPLQPKLLHLLRSHRQRQRLRRCCPQITWSVCVCVCVYVYHLRHDVAGVAWPIFVFA